MIQRPPRPTRTDTLLPYTTLFRSPVVSKLMPPIAAAQADVEVAKLLGHAQFAVKILAGACAEVANQRRTVGIGHGRLAAIRLVGKFGDSLEPLRGGAQIRRKLCRSEERRGGKECGRKCRYRWSAFH